MLPSSALFCPLVSFFTTEGTLLGLSGILDTSSGAKKPSKIPPVIMESSVFLMVPPPASNAVFHYKFGERPDRNDERCGPSLFFEIVRSVKFSE
jgi:hypothetical protein